MYTQYSLDLRVVRRKTGFSQKDIAHLIGANQATVSQLECGRREPSLVQTMTLSMIFGRTFQSLFAAIMKRVRRDLRQRLRTLPKDASNYVGTKCRRDAIDRLKKRVAAKYVLYDSS